MSFEDRIKDIVAGAAPKTETSPENVNDGNNGGSPDNTSENTTKVEDNANQIQNDQSAAENNESTNQGLATPDNTNEAGNQSPELDENFIKILEESSGGLFKTKDSIKEAAEKLSKFDEIEKSYNELKAEKDNIFANDYVKFVNDLYKSGKTDEQVEEFKRLHKLGDISTLSPKEVLVQQKISAGMVREVAEALVEREYGLNKISLDADSLTEEELKENQFELKIIEEKMRVDSADFRKQLQDSINAAKLNSTISPEEKKLKEAAALKSYQEKLAPLAEKLSAEFPKSIEFGDEKRGKLSFDIDAEFRESIKGDVQAYFLDQEVNQTSVDEFIAVKKAVFLSQNIEKFGNALIDHGINLGKKTKEEEIVNNSGLERQGVLLNSDNGFSEQQLFENAMKAAR